MSGCGCTGCGPSASRALERAADPARAKLAARGCGDARTIGKLLPTFVTPSSVRDLKARLNPAFQTTNADVKACDGLDSRERSAWAAFYASWEHYRGSEETFWGVTAEYDAGLIFEKSLQEWQGVLESKCRLSAPKVKTEDREQDLSAVKWAAAAVIAIAVVYGIKQVV